MKLVKSPATIALIMLTSGIVYGDTIRNFSGTECGGWTKTDEAGVQRDNNGCMNVDPTNTGSVCAATLLFIMPISGGGDPDGLNSVDYNDIKVNYYDGRTAVGGICGQQTQNYVDCTIGITNTSGTVYNSTTLSSSASGTGYGVFDWTDATGLPHDTGTANGTVAHAAIQHVYCHVPGHTYVNNNCTACTSDTNYSKIMNYRIDSTNP